MLQEVCFVFALCAAKSGKIRLLNPFVNKPKTIDCSGLPIHDFKCLTNKEMIGKGAYGAVFTANWQTVPDAGGKSAEKVVVKKLLGEDILDKKMFVKEARIIQELKHPNIVKFKGICNNPFALILEFLPAECK